MELIRYNGKGELIDETYQPIIPELIELLTEVANRYYEARNMSEEDIERLRREQDGEL